MMHFARVPPHLSVVLPVAADTARYTHVAFIGHPRAAMISEDVIWTVS
jgi:hypothetical protein